MTTPRKCTAPADTAVAYVRVSTDEQAASGAGLDAQRATVAAEATRRGLTVVATFSDEGISGKSVTNRPGLAQALAAVETGTAAVLIVAKLDRLSRSVRDSAELGERSRARGWSLVSADLAVDTSTPAGKAASAMMTVFSELERDLIGQRTREALAVKRAQGVRLGRPSVLPRDVVRRIVAERAAGSTLWGIANGLTADNIATARGKAGWKAASVRAVLLGQDAAALHLTV